MSLAWTGVVRPPVAFLPQLAARVRARFRARWRPVFGLAALLIMAPAAAETLSGTVLNTRLAGVDHQQHRLDEWRGRLRVVNFWATWCLPCRSEIPALIAARRDWRARGVEVIGVAVDSPEDVAAFARQAGITYPLLLAPEQGPELMRAAGNRSGGLPFTLLIDGQGRVLQRHAGLLENSRLQQWLQEAVKLNRS